MTPRNATQSAKNCAQSEIAAIQFAVDACILGLLLVASSKTRVCSIILGDDRNSIVQALQEQFPNSALVENYEELSSVLRQIASYLEKPTPELDVALDMQGTAFQQQVWQALMEIPLGSTSTYSDIAKRIGSPKAVRAVASACAANKLAVIIPCHRVVKSNGDISGYRWGVARKSALLERESKVIAC